MVRYWQYIILLTGIKSKFNISLFSDTQDPHVILDLIEAHPEALLTADGGGFIPLHRAINRKVPNMKIVKLLLDCAPKSVEIKTTNGNLPLHWLVCQDTPSLPAITLVYSSYPEAIHVSNEKGMTPLDILLESSSTKKEALDYIMQNLQ